MTTPEAGDSGDRQRGLPDESAAEIVRPLANKKTPSLPSVALMVATTADFTLARSFDGVAHQNEQQLYNGRLLWDGSGQSAGYAIAGPMLGAPQAAMVLETLAAWGVRRALFWGWCGAVAGRVGIGEIILPTGAFVDEGTSLHYGRKHRQLVASAESLNDSIRAELRTQKVAYHEGPVWTTDGVFRETADKVIHFQRQGALAVEMELAALFSVGRFRGIEVAGLLVVSDDLSQLVWQPGFKTKRFKTGRRKLGEVIQTLCRKL